MSKIKRIMSGAVKVLPLVAGIMFLLPTYAFANYTISTNTNVAALADWGSVNERVGSHFVTIGAGTADSVDFCLKNDGGSPSGIVLLFMADSGGSPSTVIASSTASGAISTAQRYTFTFSSPVSLSAATDYWIMAVPSGGGSTLANCGLGSDTSGYATKYSSNNGASWSTLTGTTQNFSFLVTESGGGGGATTTTASTTMMSNPNQDVANGIYLYFVGFFGIIWLFRKR